MQKLTGCRGPIAQVLSLPHSRQQHGSSSIHQWQQPLSMHLAQQQQLPQQQQQQHSPQSWLAGSSCPSQQQHHLQQQMQQPQQRGSLVQTAASAASSSAFQGPDGWSGDGKQSSFLSAFWRFLRPHTIRGTILGTSAVVTKVSSACAGHGQPSHACVKSACGQVSCRGPWST